MIVATQMLESMVTHLRPTRAEVSDVATAIFDGADAIMLSAETATGRYPAEAVEVMARIAERAEQAVLAQAPIRRRRTDADVGVGFPEALSDAAAMAAHVLDARAIVAFTQSGFSARLISHERPDVPIIAFTPFGGGAAPARAVVGRDLAPHPQGGDHGRDVRGDRGDAARRRHRRINDLIVIISGSPMWVAGTTNLMKLHRVGERR